jgi:hypothetical protein
MEKRLELQELLENILGSPNVYFQPPPSVRMSYPAIVFARNDISAIRANNNAYKVDHEYTVTLIDRNPDTGIVDELIALPYCSFSRHYTADNLNHYVFSLFYK